MKVRKFNKLGTTAPAFGSKIAEYHVDQHEKLKGLDRSESSYMWRNMTDLLFYLVRLDDICISNIIFLVLDLGQKRPACSDGFFDH